MIRTSETEAAFLKLLWPSVPEVLFRAMDEGDRLATFAAADVLEEQGARWNGWRALGAAWPSDLDLLCRDRQVLSTHSPWHRYAWRTPGYDFPMGGVIEVPWRVYRHMPFTFQWPCKDTWDRSWLKQDEGEGWMGTRTMSGALALLASAYERMEGREA